MLFADCVVHGALSDIGVCGSLLGPGASYLICCLEGSTKSFCYLPFNFGAQNIKELPGTCEFCDVHLKGSSSRQELVFNEDYFLDIYIEVGVEIPFMRCVSVMEWNLNTPSEWDWENLTMYSGRAIELPRDVEFSRHETEGNVVVDNGSIYSSGSGGFSGSAMEQGSLYKSSFSASVDSSSKERLNTFVETDGFPKDSNEKEELSWMGKHVNISNMGEPSVVSAEPIIGLKLGGQTCCEDICTSNTTKATSFSVITTSPSPTMKRSRVSYQSSVYPCCQVEGCNLDLASAKDYHRRHRICASHSKSPKVILGGMERRFCQQCSRFHDLSEFDDRKRSCRRRLSAHNARRRRPQPEHVQFSSTQLSSSICDRRQQMNFPVNRIPNPVSNPTWESACNFKGTLGTESFLSLAKGGDMPSDVMTNAISSTHLESDMAFPFQSVTPRLLNHGLQASTMTSNSLVAPELQRAFSLLSTSSWGLNEPEPTSLDQFVHGNNISLAQPGMPSELQNWELPSSEYVRVKQTPSQPQIHKLDMHNISSPEVQEFNSFKTPPDSDCFYSSQIS